VEGLGGACYTCGLTSAGGVEAGASTAAASSATGRRQPPHAKGDRSTTTVHHPERDRRSAPEGEGEDRESRQDFQATSQATSQSKNS
jgi:hypothetical protein